MYLDNTGTKSDTVLQRLALLQDALDTASVEECCNSGFGIYEVFCNSVPYYLTFEVLFVCRSHDG
jgi:hypothetical protein